MLSKLHEAIGEMLRSKPELVLVLLRMVRSDVPTLATAATVADALSSLVVAEYRPDAVIQIRDSEGELASVVVFEVQLHRDEQKLWSLPAYQALARARHKVACEVVILAPSRSVAAWLRLPMALGGGSTFRATVIGPEELRAIDLPLRSMPPEIGFLRAIASEVEDDATLVLEAIGRLSDLPVAHAVRWRRS